MTTVAQARAALVSAVGAKKAPAAPPYCLVFSDGTDFTGLGGSSVEWGFRVTCVAGIAGEDATNSIALGTYVLGKVSIIQALAGWRLVRVSPEQVRTIAGGDQLTADIAVTTKVDI